MTTTPVDKKNMAYLIMFWEGVGNLFPWNAFITASSYYAQRFCGTTFESSFENYFSITYTLSQTIGLALSVLYAEKFHLQQRIVTPLLLYGLIFAVTTGLVGVTDIDSSLLFGVTVISAFLCGVFGAALSGGLFSLGAMLPPAYTGAIMNGQGLAGLVVSVSALLTSLAGEDTSDCDDDKADDGEDCTQSISYSALAYFLIATFVLLSCAGAYFWLKKMEFTKYYISRALGEPLAETTNPLLADNNAELSNPTSEREGNQPLIKKHSDDDVGGLVYYSDTTQNLTKEEVVRRMSVTSVSHETFHHVWEVYQQIMIPSLSVCCVFTVTIAIFPSLIVFVESTEKCHSSNRFFNDLFIPFLFLMFNVFDFIGRVAAGATRPIFTAKNIWIAAVARIIFWPLFLLLNISDSKLPVVFSNDAFPILFMAIMAFSNGYVASNAMMMGASIVAPQDSGLAGNIMVFSLTVGLFFGACFSFLIVVISQGSV